MLSPVNHTSRSPHINVMVTAVQKAAKGLIRDFGELEHLQVARKGLGDFVSAADERSEEILLEVLGKSRPDYHFITEETGIIDSNAQSEFTWIIDPLDGTMNFLHGFPHFCITVGLRHQDAIIAAVTYDPLRDELFTAEKGQGAFVNKRRLRVGGRHALEQAMMSFVYAHQENLDMHQRIMRWVSTMTPQVGSHLRTGSCALDLAYVASGRLDAACTWGMKPWDIAAGILLVSEAGGFVTTHKSQREVDLLLKGDLVLGNNWMHGALLKSFKA